MSDEKKEIEKTHGFEIHHGDHDKALEFMKHHMNTAQVTDMVHRAKEGHSANFMATHNGSKLGDYKLVLENGKLKIHHDSHS
ncbi:MAG: hypothetical protein WC662_02045 [Candidatus Paceibacterota bacterium]|jgi:hypothetical protein